MRRCLVTLIAWLAYISSLSAQQPKVLAPHVPIPQRIAKSQELPLPPAKAGSTVYFGFSVTATFWIFTGSVG